jgi:tetratricopeptide (TPR) repeat protein
LTQKPTLANVYVRLGLLYGATCRFDEALETFARGARVDPLLPTLAAAEVLVHIWRRDFATAVAVGSRAVELHPHLQTVRVNYAQALQLAGRLDEALVQYQIASIVAPDVPWLRALEGACLAALGAATRRRRRSSVSRRSGTRSTSTPTTWRSSAARCAAARGARRARARRRRELRVALRARRGPDVRRRARRAGVSPLRRRRAS